MLRAELRKTWSRPLLLLAFALVCIAQVHYVVGNYSPYTRQFSDAANQFGGQMDETWKQSVFAEFDRLWPTPPQTSEDYRNATAEQNAILSAHDAAFFTEQLDAYAQSAKDFYGTDPDFDVDRIDAALAELRKSSEKGALVFGYSPAGAQMSSQYMVTWGFLIFMMILCGDQFAGELNTGMMPMQDVTKEGRKKLLRTKFLVCQISGLFVWVVCNGLYVLSLTLAYRLGNLSSIVQDFSYNFCPYSWTTGEFMAVVLLFGLIASQLVSAFMFLLARMGKTLQKSFALIGGSMVLPYLIAFQADLPVFYIWLPCLMHNSWLWTGVKYWKVLGCYIEPWLLAVGEMIVIAALTGVGRCHFMKQAELAME